MKRTQNLQKLLKRFYYSVVLKSAILILSIVVRKEKQLSAPKEKNSEDVLYSKEAFEPILGLCSSLSGTVKHQYSDNDQHLLINHNGILVAMVENKGNFMSMHFRGSLLPNFAAKLGQAFLGKEPVLVIGESFEITDKKTWIFGEEALDYVAKHNVELWLKSDDAKRFKQTLEREEAEDKLKEDYHTEESDLFDAEQYPEEVKRSKFLH